MTRARIAILAAAGALAASGASAQSAEGFYRTGVLEAEYLRSGGDGETALYGDVTLGYLFPGSGLGLEFGFEALHIDSSTREALYPVFVVGTDFGQFRIGMPRPALDSYIDVPVFAGARAVDVGGLGLFRGSASRFVNVALEEDHYGLRYDGRFGALRFGASWHRYSDPGASTLTLGGDYEVGAGKLMWGLEHIDAPGTNETDVTLGGKIGGPQWEAGLLHADRGGFLDGHGTTLFGTYRPIEGLDLNAQVMSVSEAGISEDLYSLGASYTHASGAFVQSSVSDGSSSSTLYDVSIGFRF